MSIAVLPPLPTLRKTGCGPVHALAPKYDWAKTPGVVSVVCGGGGSERRSRRRHPPWLWLPAFEELGRRCTAAQWHTGVHGGSWGTRAYTREAYKDTDTRSWTRVGRGPTTHRWESNERHRALSAFKSYPVSHPFTPPTGILHLKFMDYSLVQVKGKIWQETPAQATWFALGSHLARW